MAQEKEEATTPQAKPAVAKNNATYGVAILGLMVVLLAAGAVFLWNEITRMREESETKSVGMQEQVKRLDSSLVGVTGQLKEAQAQLQVSSEIKKTLDALNNELGVRVAAVESVAPEQDAELDEFANQMGALQTTLTDLNSAMAVLKNESATKAELDDARKKVDASMTGINKSVKGLDRATTKLTRRVRTLEKTTETAVTSIDELKASMVQLQNSVDTARKEMREPRPAGDAKLDFQPGNKPAPAPEAAPAPAPAPAAAPAEVPAANP